MKHGMSSIPEYTVWANMLARCYRKTHPKYPHYGGRGIGVCDQWRKCFPQFLSDIGTRPFANASIGRINNDGNYEPSTRSMGNSKTANE